MIGDTHIIIRKKLFGIAWRVKIKEESMTIIPVQDRRPLSAREVVNPIEQEKGTILTSLKLPNKFGNPECNQPWAKVTAHLVRLLIQRTIERTHNKRSQEAYEVTRGSKAKEMGS